MQRAGWVLAGGAPHLGLIKDSSQLAPHRSTCQGRESLGELKGKEFLGFITKGGMCNFKGFTRAGLARVSTAVESSELPEKQGS